MNNTVLNCKVAKKCNSCQLNNLPYDRQLAYKENKCKSNLKGICKVQKIVGMENPYNYRNKAQVCVKIDKDKSYTYGMYKSSTKSITKAENCMLHTKRANEVFKKVTKLLKSFKVIPFDFHRKKGYLKSMMIREGFQTNELMLILSVSLNEFTVKNTFVSALQKNCPEITTAVVTVNEDDEKIAVGKTIKILFGKGYIEDILCGKRFIISPESFYQINPVQTEKLYSTAIELANLTKDNVVLDAYCGIGTIGIIASNNAKKVYSVELNEKAIENAEQNAKLNGINNIEFFAQDAKDFIKNAKVKNYQFDTVFVDPPRAGCSKEFLDSLCSFDIKKIVYISCNVSTQARDIRYLMKKAGYKAECCIPFDMFPHTNHIESVVLLTKIHK